MIKRNKVINDAPHHFSSIANQIMINYDWPIKRKGKQISIVSYIYVFFTRRKQNEYMKI